jgi:hypothetical protein
MHVFIVSKYCNWRKIPILYFPLSIAWVILSTSSMMANSMNLFSLIQLIYFLRTEGTWHVRHCHLLLFENIAIYNIEILHWRKIPILYFSLSIGWVILSTSSIIANSMNLFSLIQWIYFLRTEGTWHVLHCHLLLQLKISLYIIW